MPISEKTYERIALEDPDGKWELHCGRLRSKPGMTTQHNDISNMLGFRLQQQLPPALYRVRIDSSRARFSPTRTYIPDVMVIPTTVIDRMKREQPARLEVHREPLPLVVEVWSPSTGRKDFTDKLPGYQSRGDAEIWLIHPRERTLTASIRQANGSYREEVYRGGLIRPASLPDVVIDLDELFAL